MRANMILELVLAAIGIVMLVCPYDKIKAIFPKAKSERIMKMVGAIVAIGSLAGLVMGL